MIDRCKTCHRPFRRSNPQNARYWLLLHLMAEKLHPSGHSYSADQWHIYAKSRWIGCDDVRLPNGRIFTIPRSSAELDTAAFNEYMTKVESWAGEHGVWLDSMEGAA